MDFQELIANIPDLLLLVVPGYISVRIKEVYRLEKKSEKDDITLYSILYSFFIGIIYSIIETLTIYVWPNTTTFFVIDIVKQLAFLFLAVLLGFFLVKIPQTSIGIWIDHLFNKNLSPEPSVWIKAMKNTDGAWARVYLENGLIYTGMLLNYTSGCDEEREVLLSQHSLSVRNDGVIKGSEDFCILIEDNRTNSKAKVLLNQKVIVAIEIL